jgi:hypothetical protein
MFGMRRKQHNIGRKYRDHMYLQYWLYRRWYAKWRNNQHQWVFCN